MKLSADPKHPDYHEVVNFVKDVRLGGVVLKHCVSIDTKAGIATVVTQPMQVDGNMVATHDVRGKVEIDFHNGGTLFEHFYKDWEAREKLREQEVHSV